MLLIWTTGISKIFVMTVEVQFCPLIWLFSWWRWHLQDLRIKLKYLVTFTLGLDQKDNIDAAVKKVISVSSLHQSVLWLVFNKWLPSTHSAYWLMSIFLSLFLILGLKTLQFYENFTILLFHYDGRVSDWDKFEWSKRAIHISARKQTKWLVVDLVLNFFGFTLQIVTNFDQASYSSSFDMKSTIFWLRWYAKCFLHLDIVAPYQGTRQGRWGTWKKGEDEY